MKKKLAIIGTVGVPSSYGGFETLVDNLLDYLPEKFDVTVYCQDSAYQHKLLNYKNADLKYVKFKANGVSSIVYDSTSIFKSYKNSDVLLILGVSGTIILPFIKPFFKGKIITNIDGLEWKREKWNFATKKFLKFSEMLGVKFSDSIVADNLHIQRHVLSSYKKESYLIAYGGDHVNPTMEFSIEKTFGIKRNQYFFTVCRIEPENNLDMMVQAYKESKLEIPYVIIGNFNSSKYGIGFREKYNSINGLLLLDPIYDQEILDQFRSNCFYYLHGHSAGGTNPSLVEAMFLELPIIAFGVNYNRATTMDTALYFDSKEKLKDILTNLYSIDRESLKSKLYTIANEKYKWEDICASYISLF